jgi:hypothetical protein
VLREKVLFSRFAAVPSRRARGDDRPSHHHPRSSSITHLIRARARLHRPSLTIPRRRAFDAPFRASRASRPPRLPAPHTRVRARARARAAITGALTAVIARAFRAHDRRARVGVDRTVAVYLNLALNVAKFKMSSRVARVERRRFGGDEGTRSCASSRALATRRGVVATLCRGGARARSVCHEYNTGWVLLVP